MLSFFRTNQTFANLFILIVLLILRLPALIFNYEWTATNGGYLFFLFSGVIGKQSLLSFSITMIVLFAQIIILNEINLKNRLTRTLNLFPGYFLALMASSIPAFMVSSPVHFANLFLLLAINELLQTFRVNDCADRIFNAGLLIGIASLFYWSFSIFLLLSIFGLNLMRALKGKEILMLLFGSLVPYILLITYCFWSDTLPVFFREQFGQSFGIYNWALPSSPWSIGQLFGFIILIFLTVLISGQIFRRRVMQEQKKITLFYWMALLVIFTLFIQTNIQMDHLGMLLLPLGILLGIGFSILKPQYGEVLNLLLIILILAMHYHVIFLPNL